MNNIRLTKHKKVVSNKTMGRREINEPKCKINKVEKYELRSKDT
jgi:hypothetical protein